jgi:hypothetical protein
MGLLFCVPGASKVHYLDNPSRFFYIELNLIMMYENHDKYDGRCTGTHATQKAIKKEIQDGKDRKCQGFEAWSQYQFPL